jgi:hypothetical protein
LNIKKSFGLNFANFKNNLFTMNKLILLIGLLFVFTANQAQQGPEITFEKETHDFGQIKEGAQPTYEFKFTNKGDAPLVLTDVKPSCGCTAPTWTREPIMPGKDGFIKVAYNSNGRPGRFHKSVTVTTNQPSGNVKLLYIKGDVLPKATGNQQEQSPVRIKENN